MHNKLVATIDELTSEVEIPSDIAIDCSTVSKGIDNYHVDVEMSGSFTFLVRELVSAQVKLIVAGRRLTSGNTDEMVQLRETYADMMKVTLHRAKTDLTTAEIVVLQFSVVKFIVEVVRDELEQYGAQLEETLGQQQYSGSRSLLATQERLQWFRKHSHEFLFRINRQLMRQLQREENNQLKKLRSQVLGDVLPESINIMFCPLIYGRSPGDPLVLLEYYTVWPAAGSGFNDLNRAIEELLVQALPSLETPALKVDRKLEAAQAEVYDELGGLFAVQSLLGPAENQKEDLSEALCWMEQPGNVRWLFDERLLQKHLDHVKETDGRKAAWKLKSDIKKLLKTASQISKAMDDNHDLRHMYAGQLLKDELTQQDIEILDIGQACAFVGGGR